MSSPLTVAFLKALSPVQNCYLSTSRQCPRDVWRGCSVWTALFFLSVALLAAGLRGGLRSCIL